MLTFVLDFNELSSLDGCHPMSSQLTLQARALMVSPDFSNMQGQQPVANHCKAAAALDRYLLGCRRIFKSVIHALQEVRQQTRCAVTGSRSENGTLHV